MKPLSSASFPGGMSGTRGIHAICSTSRPRTRHWSHSFRNFPHPMDLLYQTHFNHQFMPGWFCWAHLLIQQLILHGMGSFLDGWILRGEIPPHLVGHFQLWTNFPKLPRTDFKMQMCPYISRKELLWGLAALIFRITATLFNIWYKNIWGLF